MENVSKIYVGVDISKNFLDIALNPLGKHFRVKNTETGLADLLNRLSRYTVVRVACESSGGYEKAMIKLLCKSGYRVELLDPKQVRYFILSKKVKAKTDKIDAHMIALYTASNEPEYAKHQSSEKHEELRDMVRIRHDFIEDVSREKKRIKQTTMEKSKDFVSQHIAYLEEQIKLVDIEIEQLVNANKEWKEKRKLLLSIPGIGTASSAALIAEMIELGSIENKQAASLLGVAPRTKQSGDYVGTATISGGRFMIRRIMYMCALSACHTKGKFGQYYRRLKSKGKKPKVCLVALMNKMISIANTLIRKGEMWDPVLS